MEWHLTKNELPKENVYVLIHIPNRPWDAGTSTVFYDVAHVVKGITEEEREKLDDSDKRKITWCFGDEGFGNNLVPYGWQTFGPTTYYGQEVLAWAYIDEFKGETIDNAEPSEFNIIYYKGQYYLQINVNDDYATKIQLPLLEDELKDVQLAIDKLEQVKRERDYFKRVLSIIKEKNVHLDYLNECSSAKQYNKAALLGEELSDGEFNLLKEFSKK